MKNKIGISIVLIIALISCAHGYTETYPTQPISMPGGPITVTTEDGTYNTITEPFTIYPLGWLTFNPIYKSDSTGNSIPIYKGKTHNSDNPIRRTYSLNETGPYHSSAVSFDSTNSNSYFTVYIRSENTINKTHSTPISLFTSYNDSTYDSHNTFNTIKYGLYDNNSGKWTTNPAPTNFDNNRWLWESIEGLANEFTYSQNTSLNHLDPYEVRYEKITFKFQPQVETTGTYKFGLDKPKRIVIRPANTAYGTITLY